MHPHHFLMVNLSAFCFPSHPWVSIPKIALIKQSLWSWLCLWPAWFLLWLWCSQTTGLLIFKLPVLPSSAGCRAGTLWNHWALSCIQDAADSAFWCSALRSQRTTRTSHGGEAFQMLQVPEILEATQALGVILTHCKCLFINSRWVWAFNMPTDRIVHLCVRKGRELPAILTHPCYIGVWASMETPPIECSGARISARTSSTAIDTPSLQSHCFLGLGLLI